MVPSWLKAHWPYAAVAAVAMALAGVSVHFADQVSWPWSHPTPPGPALSLPDPIVTQAGSVEIAAVTTAAKVRFVVPAGLCSHPVNPKTIHVWPDPYKVGTWTVQAMAVVSGEPEFARTTVTFGAPGPGPTPPGPTPGPAPIPVAGLRVLVVYDKAKVGGFGAVLFGKQFRDALTVKTVVGADGKTHEFRFYDPADDLSNEAPLWQAAMQRPRASVPWLIVSNGVSGFEGPLPSDVNAALAIVSKYEGGK